MSYATAINEILVLFVIMLIGFIAQKKGVLNESVQSSISTIMIKISMPALVFAASRIERTSGMLLNVLSIMIVTTASYIFFIILSTLFMKLFKYESKTSAVFIALIVFANVGFMGYPVARALFGDVGVFYTSIVNLVFAVFLWTYGVLLFNSSSKINLKNLVNPGTIAALLALILFAFGIKLPYIIYAPLDFIGRMTTPLSMLLIGSLIAKTALSSVFSDLKVLFVSLIRLLVAPLITASVLYFLKLDSIVISICTVMAAMPSGATNAIFAKEFDADASFASIGVFVTTLLCIVTLPAIIFFMTDVLKIVNVI